MRSTGRLGSCDLTGRYRIRQTAGRVPPTPVLYTMHLAIHNVFAASTMTTSYPLQSKTTTPVLKRGVDSHNRRQSWHSNRAPNSKGVPFLLSEVSEVEPVGTDNAVGGGAAPLYLNTATHLAHDSDSATPQTQCDGAQDSATCTGVNASDDCRCDVCTMVRFEIQMFDKWISSYGE